MFINAFIWVLFGTFTGLLAAYSFGRSKSEAAPYLMLGIIGALVGGAVGSLFMAENQSGFNAMGLLIALFGAIVLIGFYKNISPQS